MPSAGSGDESAAAKEAESLGKGRDARRKRFLFLALLGCLIVAVMLAGGDEGWDALWKG